VTFDDGGATGSAGPSSSEMYTSLNAGFSETTQHIDTVKTQSVWQVTAGYDGHKTDTF